MNDEYTPTEGDVIRGYKFPFPEDPGISVELTESEVARAVAKIKAEAREALLADDVIERATRAFESKWDVMIGNGDVDHLTNEEFIEAAFRAALTAAIEGDEW